MDHRSALFSSGAFRRIDLRHFPDGDNGGDFLRAFPFYPPQKRAGFRPSGCCLVALATCILVGWVIGTRVVEDEVKLGGQFRREAMFRIMIRWIAPVLLVAILISSVLNSLGIIQL